LTNKIKNTLNILELGKILGFKVTSYFTFSIYKNEILA